ncbi:uncharacterized protein BX664DRAFT_51454 [Halteromyces radiatus]|uniref:uncharacterized protein n=1 Tax=Halteromyces radiatus TaxID=101107 RepID=UPI00221EED2D|nr:uncharacterized protein BX664DRAFT_51454 [Halteromyces radiatus]KAI8076370.1 hypothetical protein BX664DRAFT_51454 [Halteromyces radiatus]
MLKASIQFPFFWWQAVSSGLWNWCIPDFVSTIEPVLVNICCHMRQLPIGQSFAGPYVEQKLSCVAIDIIPCKPLVPRSLKNIMHPRLIERDHQVTDDQGYFIINLEGGNVNKYLGVRTTTDPMDFAKILHKANQKIKTNVEAKLIASYGKKE